MFWVCIRVQQTQGQTLDIKRAAFRIHTEHAADLSNTHRACGHLEEEDPEDL
jgi:trehalose-6-phosphatase